MSSATDEQRKAAVLQTSIATLEEAKRAVETAEAELVAVLSEIRVAPRAEKTAVSRAIETALTGLRTARKKVVDVETTLAEESKR